MNLKQTLQIMAVIQSEYPDFCKGFSQEDLNRKAALWQEIFADDDAGLVGAAVKSIITADQREFAPKASHIKEEMRRLANAGEMDAAGAWSLVRKAVQNSGYEAREEFEKLPESVRRIVGSPSQLRDWAMMDSGTLNSVVASNFQRAFRNRKESERRDALLPSGIRAVITGISERMALTEGGEGP